METSPIFERTAPSLAQRSDFSCKNLPGIFQLCPRQVQRKFRDALNRSPQDWLNEERVRAAQSLLLLGTPIKQVAFGLGFKQPSHFSKQFKRYFGLSASHFIRRQRTKMSLMDNSFFSTISPGKDEACARNKNKFQKIKIEKRRKQ